MVDSRPYGDGLRRRRACLSCGHRESTIESWSGGDLRRADAGDPYGLRQLQKELALRDRTIERMRGEIAERKRQMDRVRNAVSRATARKLSRNPFRTASDDAKLIGGRRV